MAVPTFWGPEFLRGAGGNDQQLKIQALPNGTFVAVWRDGDDVRCQLFDLDGAPIGAEVIVGSVTTGLQADPEIALLSNGDFVVTWSDQRTGNFDVRAQIFRPSGAGVAPIANDFVIHPASNFDQNNATVSALPGGGFVVSYSYSELHSDPESGESFEITRLRNEIYDNSGQKLRTTELPGNYAEASNEGLNGGGYIVFGTEWSTNGVSRLVASIYIAGGTFAESFVVATNGLSNAPTSITRLANGDVLLSWTDFTGTNDTQIKGMIVKPDGMIVGSNLILNGKLSGAQSEPSVVALAGGLCSRL